MEKQLENRKVTEQDTELLQGVSEYCENIQDCINNLVEVINELIVSFLRKFYTSKTFSL